MEIFFLIWLPHLKKTSARVYTHMWTVVCERAQAHSTAHSYREKVQTSVRVRSSFLPASTSARSRLRAPVYGCTISVSHQHGGDHRRRWVQHDDGDVTD